MYHSISDSAADRFTIAPELFAAQMKYLSESKFRVLSLESAVRMCAQNCDLSRTIVLTFDDGYRDFLTTAVPIIEQYRFPATLFVVTGMSQSHWDCKGVRRTLLSPAQLRELKGRGFSLGSHTVTHRDLTVLDQETLEKELGASHAAITEMGESFIPFAYPGGTFTRRERDAVERAGYDCAVIVGGRWGNGPETDTFLLRREPVLTSDSLVWFQKRVNGFYEAHYLISRLRGVETR